MAGRVSFDELWGAAGSVTARPGFEQFGAWLNETPESELARRQSAAEAAFRSLGITFKIYGDEQAGERIIPFDIIPRIFSAAEWQRLSVGLEQRVRALNLFIADIYGSRHILNDEVVPAEIILSNPQFCIPAVGAPPPHDVYAHICGI